MGNQDTDPPTATGNHDRVVRHPDNVEDVDYTEDEIVEVELRYPGLDEEMKIETAKELAWIKRNGYPSIMAHARLTDPRFLVFVHWIMNQKFESLEEARQRLKLPWKTIIKWWNFLKDNQYVGSDIIEYYDSRLGDVQKAGKGVEGSRLEPPRSSVIRLEETLSKAGGKHKQGGMSEGEEKVVEIPEELLYKLVRSAMIGDKRGIAEAFSQLLKYKGDLSEAMKEFIERYASGKPGGYLSFRPGEMPDLDSFVSGIMKAYLAAMQVQAFREALGGGSFKVHPDGSITVGVSYPFDEYSPIIRRLEERLERLEEHLRKSLEEERFKKLEERIEALAKELVEKGRPEASREIEALREELRKLREERLKEDLKETIEDLKEALASASQGKGESLDIIDAIAKLDALLRDREMKIEQLKAEVEKAKDERFFSLLENMQEQVKELRARLQEVTKNPLQAYQELAEQIAQLEKIMESIRKGSSPKVDQDVKQRALDMLQEVVGKVTDIFVNQRASPTPVEVGARLAALPCPNCKKPIPLPDLRSAKLITCPHCQSQFEVAQEQV